MVKVDVCHESVPPRLPFVPHLSWNHTCDQFAKDSSVTSAVLGRVDKWHKIILFRGRQYFGVMGGGRWTWKGWSGQDASHGGSE
jgi:hypothetical protein